MRPPVQHWVLQRTGGLGDVCMALAACKALKGEDPSCIIWLVTAPPFVELAAACPHVDEIFVDSGRAEEAMLEARLHNPAFQCKVLHSAQYGLDPLHQVEGYLTSLGRKGLPPTHTDLELTGLPEPPEALAALPSPAPGRRRIVFHPAQGDPNRTWPKGSWEALGRRVLEEGHQLVLVGDRRSDPTKGVFQLDLPEAHSLVDCLGMLDLVSLFRRSDLFLSTDSGPVQLAGASDLAICTIYTTVAGRTRLPYRHGQPLWGATPIEPPCPQKACYQVMANPANLTPAQAKIVREGGKPLNQLFATWCLEKDRYHCLRDITPAAVWATLEPWIQVPPREREERCLAAEALALEGRLVQALEQLDALPAVDSDLQAHLLRARLLVGLDRAEAATRPLKAVLTHWPVHGEALNLLCLAFIRTGQAEAARTFGEMASRNGGPPDAVSRNQAYLEALTALEVDDPAEASEALRRAEAIPFHPDSVEDLEIAVLHISALLLQERLDAAEALLAGLGPAARLHADLQYLSGEIQYRKGRTPEALAAFQACLSLNPGHGLAAARMSEVVP